MPFITSNLTSAPRTNRTWPTATLARSLTHSGRTSRAMTGSMPSPRTLTASSWQSRTNRSSSSRAAKNWRDKDQALGHCCRRHCTGGESTPNCYQPGQDHTNQGSCDLLNHEDLELQDLNRSKQSTGRSPSPPAADRRQTRSQRIVFEGDTDEATTNDDKAAAESPTGAAGASTKASTKAIKITPPSSPSHSWPAQPSRAFPTIPLIAFWLSKWLQKISMKVQMEPPPAM
jgi:hypothetical protein